MNSFLPWQSGDALITEINFKINADKSYLFQPFRMMEMSSITVTLIKVLPSSHPNHSFTLIRIL